MNTCSKPKETSRMIIMKWFHTYTFLGWWSCLTHPKKHSCRSQNVGNVLYRILPSLAAKQLLGITLIITTGISSCFGSLHLSVKHFSRQPAASSCSLPVFSYLVWLATWNRVSCFFGELSFIAYRFFIFVSDS